MYYWHFSCVLACVLAEYPVHQILIAVSSEVRTLMFLFIAVNHSLLQCCLLPVKTEFWKNRMHLTEFIADCSLSAVRWWYFPHASLSTWPENSLDTDFTEWFLFFEISLHFCILSQAQHDGNPSLPAAGSISPSLWMWRALVTLHRSKNLVGISSVGFTTRLIEKIKIEVLIFACSCRKLNTRVKLY